MASPRVALLIGSMVLAAGAWTGCGGATGADDIVGPAADAAGANEGGVSPGADGGPSSDGGARGGDGGVNPPGAGPGGDLSQIACGLTSCAIPAEVCCVASSNGSSTYGCVAGTSCPGTGGGGGDRTALKCSSAANCPASTVCCVSQVNNGAASSCQASCGNNSAQLCDPKARPTGCPASAPCSSANIGDWGLPSTFATCGGKGN